MNDAIRAGSEVLKCRGLRPTASGEKATERLYETLKSTVQPQNQPLLTLVCTRCRATDQISYRYANSPQYDDLVAADIRGHGWVFDANGNPCCSLHAPPAP